MGDGEVIDLLRSIESELSSVKLWIPSDNDYTAAIGQMEAQLERTNELLEAILEELRGKARV